MSGRPVSDAVVSFMPEGGVKPGWRLNTPHEMIQQDIAFKPHVLVTAIGSDVAFPNHDRVRHHVYSFSKAKRFELKLYGEDESRSVHFDTAGVVAIGCNIHDRMSGYIVVVDTPYAAKSDAAGHVTLSDLPDGPGVLTIWQESQKTPQNLRTQPLSVHGDGRAAIILDVKPPRPNMAMGGG